MTRTEFLEAVTTWSALIDFCWENNCTICEEVYDGYSVNDMLNECLVDKARNCNTWKDLRDDLNSIPDIYEDCYYTDDYYETYRELDDRDFEEYKDDVLTWADEGGDIWDSDEDEDDDPEDTEEVDEPDEAPEFECGEFAVEDIISISMEIDIPEPEQSEGPEPEPEPSVEINVDETPAKKNDNDEDPFVVSVDELLSVVAW